MVFEGGDCINVDCWLSMQTVCNTIHTDKYSVTGFRRIFQQTSYFLLLENGGNGAPGVTRRLWLTFDHGQYNQSDHQAKKISKFFFRVVNDGVNTLCTVMLSSFREWCCSRFSSCHFNCTSWCRIHWNQNPKLPLLAFIRPVFVFECAVGKHPCVCWVSGHIECGQTFMPGYPFPFCDERLK